MTSATPLSRALETIKHLKAKLASQGSCQPIAVVGVGMRLPGEIDRLDDYWQALAQGRDLVRAMPAARKAPFHAEWDALPHKGGFLDDVTSFDAGFFGISPREARALDPQHRLLLEVTWEAMEHAALPPARVQALRTGLYVGITGQDYRDWQRGAPDAYWATGNGHCFAAGRVAYTMGFTGPAMAVDTACSSGLVAVHLAIQALRRGECELAVAGAVNLILSPRSTRLIQETRALSPDGVCRAFDARANGFARGEGCGVVVLKRLDHAVRDGDRVHAVLRGSAVNQDGRSSGFTAPNVLAQVALIEAALADAGLAPADIGYVEAHGTGTSLGDPIEMEALVAALGRKNAGKRLYVGSVKTNLGHLEAAAGIAGLLKVIACCQRRALPALVHYQTLNPRIDLAATGITLPTTLAPWTADMGEMAGVSSFGLSGTNAHLIVGPATACAAVTNAQVAGFELSARSPEALRSLAARSRDGLARLPAEAYAGFAYTATHGRARHPVRARVIAGDARTALEALDAIARDLPCAARVIGDHGGEHADKHDDDLAALPRHVVDLPHYPWQRAVFIPPAEPSEAPAAGRLGSVRAHVHREVAGVLGYADPSALSQDANLLDCGIDSLMAADLARSLRMRFAIDLPFTQIFEHPTVNELTVAIVGQLAAARPSEISATNNKSRTRAPRIALLFACQGGQYFGMGRELYEAEPVFRAHLDTCDRILAPQLGGSLCDLMMHGEDRDAIHHTWVTQPALVALELALAALWASRGFAAAAVIGHSLGEIAAAIHAGVLDLADGLTFAAQRGRLMHGATGGAMLAVSASPARLVPWLTRGGVVIAAINGPEAITVSGARDAIDALATALHAEGVRCHAIAVAHASHSPLMAPLLAPLRAALAAVRFHRPQLPIIANLSGQLAGPEDFTADYWCRHLREPVQFYQGARTLRAQGLDAYLEVGPDHTLIPMIAGARLLPARGAVASLRRGVDARATMREAEAALRALPINDRAPGIVRAGGVALTSATRAMA